MPPIIVTGRDDQVTSRHRQHAETKIAKLERYFDGIQRIEVVLGHKKGVAEAEIVLSVRGGKPLVCHSSAEELYAAIDTVLDKAEKQLTRLKEKVKGHKGAPTSRHPDEIPPSVGGEREGAEESGSDPDEPSYQDIVDKREYP